jgi:signal transduction histidine kinase
MRSADTRTRHRLRPFGFVSRRLGNQVALAAAGALGVMAAVFALLVWTANSQTVGVIAGERLKLAQATAASIDAIVVHATHQLAQFAALDAVRDVVVLRRMDERELGQEHRLIGVFEEIVLLDLDGVTLWSQALAAPWLRLRTEAFVGTALRTGAPAVGLIDVTGFEHPPVVAIAVPIRDRDKTIRGAAVGLLHFAHGWKAPVIPLPEGSATFVTAVIDRRGMILATTGGESSGSGDSVAEPVKMDSHVFLLSPLMDKREAGVRIHEGATEQHLVAFAPLAHAPVGVVVEERKDMALAVPIRLSHRLVGFGLAALLVTSAAAWLHARYVTRPLEDLARAMGRLAAGSLDEPVTVSRSDEIGILGRSFELMRAQLKRAAEERDRFEQQLEARVRQRTDQVRTLLGRVIHAQEEERRRLARELHDDTAQTVATVLVHVGTLRDTLSAGQERLREVLDRTLAQGARTLADLRRVIADLRPTALDDLGLIPALRGYAEERLAAARVKLAFDVVGSPRRLDPPIETALFRILQEAVSNIAKHAGATTATIHFDFQPAWLVVTVADDGRGFEPHHAATDGSWAGLGLEGMQERAELVGANLEINSRIGAGTTVRVEVPLEGQGV